MQAAAGVVDEGLKELPRQAKPESTGHVLPLLSRADPLVRQNIQSAPHEVRPTAEIQHTSGQTLVHGNISFAGERVARIEPGSVTADALLVAQRPGECPAQTDPALLHC